MNDDKTNLYCRTDDSKQQTHYLRSIVGVVGFLGVTTSLILAIRPAQAGIIESVTEQPKIKDARELSHRATLKEPDRQLSNIGSIVAANVPKSKRTKQKLVGHTGMDGLYSYLKIGKTAMRDGIF